MTLLRPLILPLDFYAIRKFKLGLFVNFIFTTSGLVIIHPGTSLYEKL